jgi:hypothetical protein
MNTSAQEGKPGAMVTEAESTARKLKELVEKFHVCWEALPDCYPVKKEIRQVGYCLELTGAHEEGVDHPSPGCVHCQHVWRALEAIAEWIIPKEYRDTGYEISPFDPSIQYSKERKYRPEVSLRIWIRHRVGFEREVDACEVRCLKEMTQRLVEIGAHKMRWDPDDGEDLGGLFRSAALRRYGS